LGAILTFFIVENCSKYGVLGMVCFIGEDFKLVVMVPFFLYPRLLSLILLALREEIFASRVKFAK
jgi:hypothetical protein